MVRARDVNRRIIALGGWEVRQRGSHRLFRAQRISSNGESVQSQSIVAQHSGDIPIGTLAAIEKQMEPVFGKGWLRQ